MEYIAYYRVSTRAQGTSGLGLEAQQAQVAAFITREGHTLTEEYTEVESGRNAKRPELIRAVAACKRTGAHLLIAKLDRLSRNAIFLLTLREELNGSGLDIRALDMPELNTLTLGLMATIAQHEAEITSKRTKDALQARKARGDTLGNPGNFTSQGRRKGAARRRTMAATNPHAHRLYDTIAHHRSLGLSFAAIATLLNDRGDATLHAKGRWTRQRVEYIHRTYKPVEQ